MTAGPAIGGAKRGGYHHDFDAAGRIHNGYVHLVRDPA